MEALADTIIPKTGLIYGDPRSSTPLMLTAPDFALERPLRLLFERGSMGRPMSPNR